MKSLERRVSAILTRRGCELLTLISSLWRGKLRVQFKPNDDRYGDQEGLILVNAP
jgi:hypothetical protein